MEKFKFLYTTNFNNKKFYIFYNENYPVYILELLDDGKLCYPQYEDFIEYFKRFQKFTYSKIKQKSEIQECSTNNELLDRKRRCSLVPKVIKDGVLITVGMALVLSGCARTSNANIHKEGNISIIEDANATGFEIEYIPEVDKYITKSYVDSETGKKVVICTTADELKEYFPDKNQDPTYDDVINTIQQNENIPEKYKELYVNALNNMKEQMPEIDLFVLNLNAERMVVEEKPGDLNGRNFKWIV